MSSSSTPLIVNHNNNTSYNINHNNINDDQHQQQHYNGVSSAGVCNNDNRNIQVQQQQQQQQDDSVILARNNHNDEIEESTYNHNINTKTITELVNKMHQIDQSSGCNNNINSTQNNNQQFKFLLLHLHILQMLENQTDSNHISSPSSATTRIMTGTEIDENEQEKQQQEQHQKQDSLMNNNNWFTIAKKFIVCRETKLLPIQSEALRWKGIHQSIQQLPNKNNNQINEQHQQLQVDNDEQNFIPNYVPSITTFGTSNSNNDIYNHHGGTNNNQNSIHSYYKRIGFNLISNIIQQRKDTIINTQYYNTVIVPYQNLLQYSQQRLQTIQLYQCKLQTTIVQKDSSYYKTIVHQLHKVLSNNTNENENENDIHDTNYYRRTNKKRSKSQQQEEQEEDDFITTTMTTKCRQKHYPYNNIHSKNKKLCIATSTSTATTDNDNIKDNIHITNIHSELITVQTKLQLWNNLIHDLQYVLTL